MSRRSKGNARLPRLTVLAYSRQELVRFSTAAERIAAAASTLTAAIAKLTELVDRMERRSGAARKANATRRANDGAPQDGTAPAPA